MGCQTQGFGRRRPDPGVWWSTSGIWQSTAGSWSLGGWGGVGGANSRSLTVELRDLAVDRRILEFWEVRFKHLAASWSFGSQTEGFSSRRSNPGVRGQPQGSGRRRPDPEVLTGGGEGQNQGFGRRQRDPRVFEVELRDFAVDGRVLEFGGQTQGFGRRQPDPGV